MYHVSIQGVDERMINIHYYYNHLVFALVAMMLQFPRHGHREVINLFMTS